MPGQRSCIYKNKYAIDFKYVLFQVYFIQPDKLTKRIFVFIEAAFMYGSSWVKSSLFSQVSHTVSQCTHSARPAGQTSGP